MHALFIYIYENKKKRNRLKLAIRGVQIDSRIRVQSAKMGVQKEIQKGVWSVEKGGVESKAGGLMGPKAQPRA